MAQNTKRDAKNKDNPDEIARQNKLTKIMITCIKNTNFLSKSNSNLIINSLKNGKDCKTTFCSKSGEYITNFTKQYEIIQNEKNLTIKNNSLRSINEKKNLLIKSCDSEIRRSGKKIKEYFTKSSKYKEKLDWIIKNGVNGKMENRFLIDIQKELLRSKKKLKDLDKFFILEKKKVKVDSDIKKLLKHK